jgi:hypothetical protein
MRALVFLPHVRDNQMDRTARRQNALKLRNDAGRFRRVLQDHNGDNAIERGIREREFLKTSNGIEPGVIPLGIAQRKINADIARVRESRLEATLPCSCVEHTFARPRVGADRFNKPADGCLKGIETIKQRRRDHPFYGSNKFGIKQAPRLVGRDCRECPVRPAHDRHRE